MSSGPKYDCGNAERRSMMLFLQGIKGLSPMGAPMREVETLCRSNRNPRICVIVNVIRNVMLEFRMTPEQRTRALPMWCTHARTMAQSQKIVLVTRVRGRIRAQEPMRANEKCALALHAIHLSLSVPRYLVSRSGYF